VNERAIHQPLRRSSDVRSSRTPAPGAATRACPIDRRARAGTTGQGGAFTASPAQDDRAAGPHLPFLAPILVPPHRSVDRSPSPRSGACRSPASGADHPPRHPSRHSTAHRREQSPVTGRAFVPGPESAQPLGNDDPSAVAARQRSSSQCCNHTSIAGLRYGILQLRSRAEPTPGSSVAHPPGIDGAQLLPRHVNPSGTTR